MASSSVNAPAPAPPVAQWLRRLMPPLAGGQQGNAGQVSSPNWGATYTPSGSEGSSGSDSEGANSGSSDQQRQQQQAGQPQPGPSDANLSQPPPPPPPPRVSSVGYVPRHNPQRCPPNMTPQELDRALDDLENIANILDTKWRLMGIRFGLDTLIGLVPGGDLVTGALAAYIGARANRLGVPVSTQAAIWTNIGVDTLIGTVPILGTIADQMFKCNRRNVDYVLEHFGRPTLAARQAARDAAGSGGSGRRRQSRRSFFGGSRSGQEEEVLQQAQEQEQQVQAQQQQQQQEQPAPAAMQPEQPQFGLQGQPVQGGL